MLLVRRVEGQSMLPVYEHGRVVVALRFKRPRIGDVVIVRHHRVEIIKRITQLRDDEIYVVGDNPAESTDSRHFGWLPAKAVRGVVLIKRGKATDSADD